MTNNPGVITISEMPMTMTRKPMAQTTATATSDSMISLRPAFLALPECFMRAQDRLLALGGKG